MTEPSPAMGSALAWDPFLWRASPPLSSAIASQKDRGFDPQERANHDFERARELMIPYFIEPIFFG